MLKRLFLIFAFIPIAPFIFHGAFESSADTENMMPEPFSFVLDPNFFPLFPWGSPDSWNQLTPGSEAGLRGIAECGFTMACFVKPEFLPECEALGLRAIVHPTIAGLGTWGQAWKTLSHEEIDSRIRDLVEMAGDSPAVLGYTIMDEPSVLDFPALARAVAAVKRHAPGKLAYINLFPNYATIGAPDRSQLGTENYTEYLERFVREVHPQFISYDNYAVLFSDDLRITEQAALYYENLMEVRRVAQKYGLPYWNIGVSNQIRPFTPPPSPANLALQAYTTLAAGYGGLSWFTYHVRGYDYAAIDQEGKRTEVWEMLRAINEPVRVLGTILSRAESTGVFFTDPPPADGLPILPGRLVQGVRAEVPVMVGEFRGEIDERNLVMVVNLSLERSARIELEWVSPESAAVRISGVDGRPVVIQPERGLWLTAGQGALLSLDSHKGSK